MRPTAALAALIFIVGIVAAGVMQSAGTTTAAARVAILAADADHTAATKSVRFVITVQTSGRQTVHFAGVEDFVHHSAEVSAGPETERFVAAATYRHVLPGRPLPAGKSWVRLSGVPVPPDAPDASPFLTVLRAVKDIKVVGNPKLAGVDVTEYSAAVVVAKVPSLAGIDKRSTVTTKVWVDGSKRIRQMELDVRYPGFAQDAIIELSGYGRQAPVAAPPGDEVVPDSQAPAYRQSGATLLG